MTSETLIKSLSDLISVSLEKWIASHHLSLHSAPLTSALRAPPSKGRRDRYTQNAPHSRPFLWKGLSSVARDGVGSPPYVGNAFPPVLLLFPPLSLPHRGRLTIREYRHLKCGEAATFIPHFSLKPSKNADRKSRSAFFFFLFLLLSISRQYSAHRQRILFPVLRTSWRVRSGDQKRCHSLWLPGLL